MSKKGFSFFRRKALRQVLLIAGAALAVGLFALYALIDGIWEKPLANGFLSFCQGVLGLSGGDAYNLYSHLCRYKPFLLMMGFVILMLLIFYFALARFTRYFSKISSGIDQLASDTSQDITLPAELSPMEKQLNSIRQTLQRRALSAQQNEQRKNDLVMYLAHDLKTPLTSIIGYLSLLQEAADMPKEQRDKYVGITLDKAARLEQLIDEFFDITRFNLQSIVLDKTPLNLPYMLEQMVDEFYPMLEAQGKKAELHAPETLRILGDGDKLARVFNNILKNALAYSSPGSTISISCSLQACQACVTFVNQGRTIPTEKLGTIFEKFYRLDEARSSHTGGAGLGLAIAKEIVTAHGGRIYAHSQSGTTTFTVLLPAQTEPSVAPVPKAPAGKTGRNTHTALF